MPIDPRPPIGGQSAYHHAAAPPGTGPAARGFDAALAQADEAGARRPAASLNRHGLDGRDRTREFINRQPVHAADDGNWLFGEDGFGFDDLIDVINPLQHIPIVSSIYRWITGDEISPAANMAGGALFGGPIGLAGSVANVVIEEATGRDLGEHALAMVVGDEGEAGGGDRPDMPDMAALPAPDSAEPPPDEPAVPTALSAQLAAADGDGRFIALPQSDAADTGLPFVPAAIPSASAADRASRPADEPDTAEAVLAEQMMQALDKYEALMRSRAVAAPPDAPAPGSLYDGHS